MAKTPLQTIGLFGGTFDPIHLGHIVPVIDLAAQINLDKVFLIPANIPPHKAAAHVSSKHRKAMVELVCSKYPLFTVDDRELKRNKPSYTIDTLKEIKQENPEAVIYFFIGTDSFLDLPSWYLIDEIMALCNFVVTTRPGYTVNLIDKPWFKGKVTTNQQEFLAFDCSKILLAQTKQIDISSTQLRSILQSKAQLDTPLSHVICPQVIDYIKQNNLYKP
ncbi:nicotinate-nucleotide adenylyltransferase [Thalassomonas sp. M1454]|uniref:nicotinate-nucleotide adenylyltransferase n=1 Tax=Thalassomonas sp. M1454 TaxID=2594477 RepID=UPI00117DD114|nr:nicotinate-nucleotide adenylyltransferase [Thalassomonas sp. M1454]TRX57362.1 nicotinate-nucleotide adenylyltransferase [Thalassomonas sp. M1454]